MTTADEALGTVNELLYEYMETPKDDQPEKLKDTINGIEQALKAQDELVLEIHVAELGFNALVHRAPTKILDLGPEADWIMSEVTMNHEIRWRATDGRMTIFCYTCTQAEKERNEGV